MILFGSRPDKFAFIDEIANIHRLVDGRRLYTIDHTPQNTYILNAKFSSDNKTIATTSTDFATVNGRSLIKVHALEDRKELFSSENDNSIDFYFLI